MTYLVQYNDLYEQYELLKKNHPEDSESDCALSSIRHWLDVETNYIQRDILGDFLNKTTMYNDNNRQMLIQRLCGYSC